MHATTPLPLVPRSRAHPRQQSLHSPEMTLCARLISLLHRLHRCARTRQRNGQVSAPPSCAAHTGLVALNRVSMQTGSVCKQAQHTNRHTMQTGAACKQAELPIQEPQLRGHCRCDTSQGTRMPHRPCAACILGNPWPSEEVPCGQEDTPHRGAPEHLSHECLVKRARPPGRTWTRTPHLNVTAAPVQKWAVTEAHLKTTADPSSCISFPCLAFSFTGLMLHSMRKDDHQHQLTANQRAGSAACTHTDKRTHFDA